MKTYLVTGGAGFIGSAIARSLIDRGDCVVTIDNLSTGKRAAIPEGCEFIEGDCSDIKVIESLGDRSFDAIVHMAGQSSGEISFENPIYDLSSNVQSTLALLKYAEKAHCKRFVYASSMSVYGDHYENPLVSEETIAVPKSFYAVGKLASENYMRIFSEHCGMNCVALRFFNVYGIGQNLDNLKQGMASIYLAMALNDHHISVKGDKTRFRDFVYIDDVVNAVVLAVDSNLSGFSCYNVSTGVATTVECVIENIKANLPFAVSVSYHEGTPGDQHGIYGDNSLLKKVLPWTPRCTFESGIAKMVSWASACV